jgi:micrococcal nuclease
MQKDPLKNISKILRMLGVNKRSPYYLLILIILFIFISLTSIYDNSRRRVNDSSNTSYGKPTSMQEYKVAKVIDGDTIEIVEGDKTLTVRYIGINTPETVKPNSPKECFGVEASNFNKSLVENKSVILEVDISDRDRFGRLLRYVYIKEGDNYLFINKKLVEEGYAQASTFPPDVKYSELFKESEKTARENRKGLWSSCR